MHASLAVVLATLSSATLSLAAPTPASPLAAYDLHARSVVDDGFDVADLASPVSILLYFPLLSAPSAGSTWQAGGELTVSWNTTKPYDWTDAQLPKTANVTLGYMDPDSPGYNLDFEHPLGTIEYYSGAGTANLPLPADLPTRSTYFITAGSTSVRSAQFTIEAASSSSSSSSSSVESTTTKAASSSSQAAAVVAPVSSSTTSAAALKDIAAPSSSSTTRAAAVETSSSSSSSSSTTTSSAPSLVLAASSAPSSTSSPSAAPSSSTTAQAVAASGNVAAAATTGTSGASNLAKPAGALLGAVLALAAAL